MFRNGFSRFAVLFAIFALAFSACAPIAQVPLTSDVWSIQTRTTLYWINQAASGAPGTFIYYNVQKAGDIIYMWNMPNGGYGFTMMAQGGSAPVGEWLAATGGKSNLVNTATAKQLADWLENNGWKLLPANQLPSYISKAIKMAMQATESGVAFLEEVGGSLVSFFVFPAGTDWRPQIPDGVQYQL